MEMEGLQDSLNKYTLRKESPKVRQSDLTPTQELVKKHLVAIADKIRKDQEDCQAGKPGVSRRLYGPVICSLDAEKLALIALSGCFNGAYSPASNVYAQLANELRNQALYEAMSKVKGSRKLLNKLEKRFKKWNTRQLKYAKQGLGLESKSLNRWHPNQKMAVGAYLANVVIRQGLFRLVKYKTTRKKGKLYKTVYHIEPTPKMLEQYAQLDLLAEALSVTYGPMIVRPNYWPKSPYLIHDVPFIKPSYGRWMQRKSKVSNEVQSAFNRLGATPFTVSRPVLALAEIAWNSGRRIAGLPSATPYGGIPRDRVTGEYPDTDAQTLRYLKEQAKSAWDREHREDRSRRIQLSLTLAAARKYAAYSDDRTGGGGIYFPHNACFRGRAYSIPTALSFQGYDLSRALLRFKESKPLGPDGGRWLKIHIANSYGKDKLSFDERVQWVDDVVIPKMEGLVKNKDSMLAFIDQKEVDKPFTLAAGIYELYETRTGCPTAHSSVPVSMDGSCNGLQHYSAMGLDSVGAAATNLVDSSRPSDIYSDVAVLVNKRIRKDARAGSKQARSWLELVSRSTVKRAVMTTPYGVTRRGMLDQLLADGHTDDLKGNRFDNAKYLQEVIYDAVGEVVLAARNYMDWLRTVARNLAYENIPIVWTTPVGFPALQAYPQTVRHSVHTISHQVTLRIPPEEFVLDVRSQVMGLPPNFVHSLDAAHMVMTVNALARQYKVKSFGMIHDSYATLAADVTIMQKVTREQFVKLHTVNQLDRFKKQLEKYSGMKLPELPERGDFDLNKVLTSKYFFN